LHPRHLIASFNFTAISRPENRRRKSSRKGGLNVLKGERRALKAPHRDIFKGVLVPNPIKRSGRPAEAALVTGSPGPTCAVGKHDRPRYSACSKTVLMAPAKSDLDPLGRSASTFWGRPLRFYLKTYRASYTEICEEVFRFFLLQKSSRLTTPATVASFHAHALGVSINSAHWVASPGSGLTTTGLTSNTISRIIINRRKTRVFHVPNFISIKGWWMASFL